MWEGKPKKNNLIKLRNQLKDLKKDYGSKGAVASGVTINEVNQGFSGEEIDSLVDEISFDAPDMTEKTVTLTKDYVAEKLDDILEDENLSRYIL